MERNEGSSISSEDEGGYKGTFILNTINNLMSSLEDMGLTVTAAAADHLLELRDNLAEREPGSNMTPEDAEALQDICERLQHTLRAEAKTTFAFFTTDKIISIEKLTREPWNLLDKGVFHQLSNISKYDISESARAIAFELSTAAAFHILRATEDVLRTYYYSIVKRNRVKSQSWYNITNHLRKRRDSPPTLILDNLDYIRSRFRNPTAHPEYIYSVSEAQSVFNLCIDVINRIVANEKWKPVDDKP